MAPPTNAATSQKSLPTRCRPHMTLSRRKTRPRFTGLDLLQQPPLGSLGRSGLWRGWSPLRVWALHSDDFAERIRTGICNGWIRGCRPWRRREASFLNVSITPIRLDFCEFGPLLLNIRLLLKPVDTYKCVTAHQCLVHPLCRLGFEGCAKNPTAPGETNDNGCNGIAAIARLNLAGCSPFKVA